jgi:glycerol-3-phosphate acyltransferase PlsY
MWGELLFLAGAYVLGALPLVYALGRLKGVDLRLAGTRNVGGGNLWRMGGPLVGAGGGLGDVAKGVIAIAGGIWLDFSPLVVGLGGLATVAGQSWSVFLRFGGGRGNSTALGVALAWIPGELLVALIPLLVAILVWGLPHLFNPSIPLGRRLLFIRGPSRSIPLGMFLTFALLPLVAWRWGEVPAVTQALVAIFCLILLRRLTAGVRDDLRLGQGVGRILLNRFFFDRGAV